MKPKIFVLLLTGATLFSAVVTFLITINFVNPNKESLSKQKTNNALPVINRSPALCDVNIMRSNASKLIHPVMFVEEGCKSQRLQNLSDTLAKLVAQAKSEDKVTRASIYIKEMDSPAWTDINGNDTFNPGSLMKVAIMINILQSAELNSGLMDEELFLEANLNLPGRHSASPLTPKMTYKVKDLLYSMIVDSDNDAASLLTSVVNQSNMDKLFQTIGINPPQIGDFEYTITPMEYSKLFRLLYSSSILNHESSEFALSLLSRTNYLQGLIKYIPDQINVAHKFGERISDDHLVQFHDAGIVYLDRNPYIIVLMTEGKHNDILPELVARLSSVCYEYMASH